MNDKLSGLLNEIKTEGLIWIMVALVVFSFAYWFYYHYQQKEVEAQVPAAMTEYYWRMPDDMKAQAMEMYGLTDNDINPSKVVRRNESD